MRAILLILALLLPATVHAQTVVKGEGVAGNTVYADLWGDMTGVQLVLDPDDSTLNTVTTSGAAITSITDLIAGRTFVPGAGNSPDLGTASYDGGTVNVVTFDASNTESLYDSGTLAFSNTATILIVAERTSSSTFGYLWIDTANGTNDDDYVRNLWDSKQHGVRWAAGAAQAIDDGSTSNSVAYLAAQRIDDTTGTWTAVWDGNAGTETSGTLSGTLAGIDTFEFGGTINAAGTANYFTGNIRFLLILDSYVSDAEFDRWCDYAWRKKINPDTAPGGTK